MAPDAEDEPPTCRPCRGTGKVVSGLGGTPTTIDCPWCEGTGRQIPDHDAQARFRSADEAAASGPVPGVE